MKHFACNNQEYRRRELNSVISERALREIYLKGFEIAVREAGAYSIMTTYGALNGIWTAGNYDLNLTILRNEWGFEGIVMSDWWAAIYDEGEQPSGRNTAAMVRSQNDLYMVVNDAEKNSSHDNLEEQLAQGTLTRGQLQRSARNILNMLMRSPAMTRFVSRVSEEELEAVRQLDPDDQVDFDIRYLPMKERLDWMQRDAALTRALPWYMVSKLKYQAATTCTCACMWMRKRWLRCLLRSLPMVKTWGR